MAGKLSFLIFQCLLSILFKHSLAFVFIDVPPEPSSSFSKRNDHSSLDLQNDEIFIYGSPNNNSAAHANFTVSMTNGSEAIVSLERFGRLLSSIECTNTSMTFQFKDNGAFLYAQRAWSWVNQDSRTLIIVAGTRQCGWNTHRLPFAVTSAKFDNSSMTADLAAKPEKWSDVAHTSELWVGNKQAPPPSRFTRRDFDEILAIDFEHPLPISSWEIPFDKVPNTTFTMECESCGTHGQFDFIFHFQTVANIPTGVSFTLNPKGVSASITPAIKMQINVFDKISTPLLKLGSIPLSGISIPGDILNLGPEIVIEAGAVVGPVTTTATLSGGLEIDIPDSAQLNLGLTSPSFSASGWNPTVKPIPLTIDAEVKGTVEAFVQFSTQLSFETIGHGYEIGVVLQPYIQGDFTYRESSAGACSDDKYKRPFGIEIDPSYGINLFADAEDQDNPDPPIFSNQIASATATWPSACFAFGPAQTTPASSVKTASTVKVTPTAK